MSVQAQRGPACRVATDREQQAGGVRPELIDRGRREMAAAGVATGDWSNRLEENVAAASLRLDLGEVQAIGGAAGHVDEPRPGSPVHPEPEVGVAIPVPV